MLVRLTEVAVAQSDIPITNHSPFDTSDCGPFGLLEAILLYTRNNLPLNPLDASKVVTCVASGRVEWAPADDFRRLENLIPEVDFNLNESAEKPWKTCKPRVRS
jgi:hypothetical protein